MKKLLALASLLLSLTCLAQESEFNCFGVLVGKDASADGSFILGHNEDDTDEQMLNAYINNDFFWAELPGMETADAFVNKWGVGIVSDNCKSREDREDFTDGGILYQVRVNVAKRAHTAREGVSIVAELVEKYGYRESGRSYLIADRDEIWMVSVVKGRHWVAQRIPDDAVVVIPNYYVIDRIDLSDKDNFAGSPDIVTYAQSRGWYDPKRDGEFSFREAYANDEVRKKAFNVERHKDVLASFGIVTEDPFHTPFGFKPSTKVSLNDVMNVLSLHRDDYKVGSITRNSTVVSTIFQFRRDLPMEIGTIAWIAMGHPDIEPYFPVYLGMDCLPKNFGRFHTVAMAEDKHLSDCKDMRANYPNGIWWKHLDRWNKVFVLPDQYAQRAWEMRVKMQQEIFNGQEKLEAEVMNRFYKESDFTKDRKRLAKELNDFFKNQYQKWYNSL